MMRSLLEDVSICELREMRERGMSNDYIAKSLGCSRATITRYLGKAPFRKKPGEASNVVHIDEPDPDVTIGRLKVLSTVATLHGAVCKYVVDTENGMVEIKEGLVTGVLDKSVIQDIIGELQDIQKMLYAR